MSLETKATSFKPDGSESKEQVKREKDYLEAAYEYISTVFPENSNEIGLLGPIPTLDIKVREFENSL